MVKRTMGNSNVKKRVYAVLTGVITGLINGLFGGGGGMIVVPMLKSLLNYDKKVSHATAILIILPVSIISAIVYVSTGSLDEAITFPVLLGSVLGGALGAMGLYRLSNKVVSIIFASLMFIAGVKMGLL